MENKNQDIKLCPNCGAKNKSAYKFCNECGATLNPSSYANTANSAPNNIPPHGSPYGTGGSYYGSQNTQNSYTPNYIPYGMNMYAPYEGTPDFYGVSAKDVYEFTGENPKLFNKIRTQHFSGKNGPYCWPLFILGLIFSFFGLGAGFFAMGCWYLYHKMHKPALILFAGAAVEFGVNIYSYIITLNYMLNNFNHQLYNSFLEALLEGDVSEILYEISASGPPTTILLNEVAGMISSASIILSIVLPFFAYKQYKTFAIYKIREEYTKSPQPHFALKGGIKGGLTAFVAVVYGLITIIVTLLIFSFFITEMYKKDEALAANNSNGSSYSEQIPFEDYFHFFED